jgi:UDP-2-acetamido-2-deoxy-ribo-hexuluronate aminotransferase
MHFIDLEAQFAELKPAIERGIHAVLSHGQFIMGPEVHELEERLADYCGVGHAITCANGTDALVLALRALGIGQGHAVFTTPFTFFATVEAILLVGAEPIFVDVDPATFNLDPVKLEQAIVRASVSGNAVPRAVIAVDLFGLLADYGAIEPLCATHGLDLIEDAAQAFGSEHRGRRAGAFGSIATTSFFPAKPLGCYGDGGALFTRDEGLAETLRSLRAHGQGAHKYENVRVGTNSRLDTLQAAILLAKFEAFPAELRRRQQSADKYRNGLPAWLQSQIVPVGSSSSWAQYSVVAPSTDARERALAALRAAGVPAQIYYSTPLHLQPALGGKGYSPGDFPAAEALARRIFSLPFGAYLSPFDQKRVISLMQSCPC